MKTNHFISVKIRKTLRFSFFILHSSFFICPVFGQITRSSLDTNFQNRLPNNSSGLITPLDVRQVDSNLVQSAVIKLNDTSYCEVFDTGTSFYKGEAVIHGLDSIYRCKVSLHHGVWSNPDFRFVQTIGSGGLGGSGTANYVPIYTGSATLGNSTITDNFSGSQPTSFNNKYGVLLDSTCAVSGIIYKPTPTVGSNIYTTDTPDSTFEISIKNGKGDWRFASTLNNSIIFNAPALTSNQVMSFPNQGGTIIAGITAGAPSNLVAPVAWIKIWYSGAYYWIPLYQ